MPDDVPIDPEKREAPYREGTASGHQHDGMKRPRVATTQHLKCRNDDRAASGGYDEVEHGRQKLLAPARPVGCADGDHMGHLYQCTSLHGFAASPALAGAVHPA